MSEKKQGAAEWLRGIVDEYDAEKSTASCAFMAKLLGIECGDVTCRECMAKMMTTIADRIGDVLYSSGNECRVVSITVKANEACVGVHTDEGLFLPSVNPKYLSRKKPEPADSWEKLENDARKTACYYAPAPRNEDGLTTCDGCPFEKSESCSNEMTIDLVERAKKLAGIEESDRIRKLAENEEA